MRGFFISFLWLFHTRGSFTCRVKFCCVYRIGGLAPFGLVVGREGAEGQGSFGDLLCWVSVCGQEMMEIFTSQSSKAEDGVLAKQALCHPKISTAHDIPSRREDERGTSAPDLSISIPPSWRSKRKVASLGKHLSCSGSRWEGKCRYFS